MSIKTLCLLATTLAVTSFAGAQSTPSADTFPLAGGKSAPLTIQLKDLDATWRVFTTSSSSYSDIITSAMTGGGAGAKVFTKGETVTFGADVFLVTYKPEAPDMSSIFAGGGMPKFAPLTETTVLRLSLLNLHALGAMDGIRVFDLKEQLASSQKSASLMDTMTKKAQMTTRETGEPDLLKKGTTAPDFTVHDDSGKAVKLSAYRGKVVVIDFWSTWCGPCQESLPGTNKVAARYAKQNVVFLGINVWDKKQAFHDWLPQHKDLSAIKFAIDTSDQGEDVATKLYNVSGIPTQYILDRKGKIVTSIVGYEGDDAALVKAIDTALSH